MEKGYIKIPINEVWELLNKPHRFYGDLYNEVKKLPIGKYEHLDFNKKTKIELLQRIEDIRFNKLQKT